VRDDGDDDDDDDDDDDEAWESARTDRRTADGA
jgi:hypothetical protein